MPLKTLVKVGSLSNLSDARYCAGMGVQLLGFQTVADCPGHITPVRYQEIRGWISGPSIVAEIHGTRTRQQVDEIVEAYRPDYIELGVAELLHIHHLKLPFILRVNVDESFDPAWKPAYVLLNSSDKRSFEFPRIIEVFTLAEAEVVLNQEDAGGIALLGSDEVSPGLKNYDTLAPILEMLETDE